MVTASFLESCQSSSDYVVRTPAVGTNFIFKIASLGPNIFAGLMLSVQKFSPDLKFLLACFSAYCCIY